MTAAPWTADSIRDPMNAVPQKIEALRERYLDTILSLIDEVVVETTPGESSLVEMNRYHMETGGKRLRALLPLSVAEVFEVDPARLLPFAAACELLHNATLVHDDLQDGDTIRRGAPTVWAQFGEARAINLGDAMLYWTIALAGRLEVSPERRQEITMRIVRETIRVVDGQEREFMLQGDGPVGLETYVRMVEGKTSGLFALPLVGAAYLCEADADVLEGLRDAAGHLGVLFQIQDDVLDLFGDKGRERAGSDIAEGKISALVVHALESAPTGDAARLVEILEADRDSVSQESIQWAIELFERAGSLDFALQLISKRRDAARASVSAHPGLHELVTGLVDVFLEPIQPLVSTR